MPEWNVVRSTADAQLVYGAGLSLTTVPLDSTTYVTLEDRGAGAAAKRATRRSRDALEALYRLWVKDQTSRMTLHDQMAVAETLRPGAFFSRCESMPIRVDEQGYTRRRTRQRRQSRTTVLPGEPKRDEFMKFYLDGLLDEPDSSRPLA